MSKTVVLAVVALLITGGAWYWFADQQPPPRDYRTEIQEMRDNFKEFREATGSALEGARKEDL
ncbi:MAG: hypothetical protein KDF64_22120 [Geminicoccaceae bacterium]|nr:hypothetical protein [Geminicoccaceae bacterium]